MVNSLENSAATRTILTSCAKASSSGPDHSKKFRRASAPIFIFVVGLQITAVGLGRVLECHRGYHCSVSQCLQIHVAPILATLQFDYDEIGGLIHCQ